jgi:hypothetical protein
MWQISMDYICLDRSPPIQIVTKIGELWSQSKEVTPCPAND